MITEIAHLNAKAGQADRLRDGLAAARAVLIRAEGYRGSVFYRGIEQPDSFVLRIEWDTVEAHMRTFREGPLFPEWRSHFVQFVDGAPLVAHHESFAGP
jgi:heme-degrading monooxygenase HmoA